MSFWLSMENGMEHEPVGAGRSEVVVRTDEGLPLAGGARVAGMWRISNGLLSLEEVSLPRELKVGLETEFANIGAVGDRERRGHLAGVVVQSGEANALEQDLKEDLGVEGERRLQEGSKLLSSSNEG